MISPFTHVAAMALKQGNGPQQRLAAWRAVVHLAENTRPRGADTSHTACGPGCGTCCSVNVSILEPEALGITAFIEQSLSAENRTQIVSKLETLHLDTRWLDDEERMMVRKSCAFLDEQQNCSIHPVRPLKCRGLTSTDPAQCRDAIAMLALGEAPRIVCNLEQKQLFDAAYQGLATALGEYACDNKVYRLTGLLYHYLHNEKGRPYMDGP